MKLTKYPLIYIPPVSSDVFIFQLKIAVIEFFFLIRNSYYHRAYYSLEAYSWLENYALEHSRSPEDILLEREEMTTRLHLIAALPVALAHATPTQARRVHAYYIAGIKQPEISRREGVHSSKVSVSIRRGLRNMRRCYDDLFQTE